jgi:hypothetical protein
MAAPSPDRVYEAKAYIDVHASGPISYWLTKKLESISKLMAFSNVPSFRARAIADMSAARWALAIRILIL